MAERTVDRRDLLKALGAGSIGAAVASGVGPAASAAPAAKARTYQGVSDRKIRVGIVGYGVCRFGAAFGFQDHPNVRVTAVSDLIPDRRAGLMKACRCEKSYESLEVLVKDKNLEAVFVATDAPSHARHAMEVLRHDKDVMCAVPATFGSVEEGEALLETVRKTGRKYMMAETTCFRPDCYAMRQVFRAGGFGRLTYSEGEYFHFFPKPFPSFKGWRTGLPPQWYPTHSMGYYVGVTGGRFTSVSCVGFRGKLAAFQPEANRYKNPFSDEIALLSTSEGGSSRMAVCWGVQGYHGELGRVFGETGSMIGTKYQGTAKKLPDLAKPPLPKGMPGGGHGGSHGYLTDEFVTAILADRKPLVDIYQALALTVPGIIAHQSALRGGELLKIPQYVPPAS